MQAQAKAFGPFVSATLVGSGKKDGVSVPVLVEFLSHTNPLVRTEVAEGLGNFGTNAQPAFRALVSLLSDRNSLVRRAATNALKQIDPEAAVKAGVK